MTIFDTHRIVLTDSIRLWILKSVQNEDADEILTNVVLQLSRHDRRRWERYRCVQKKHQFLLSRHAIWTALSSEFGCGHRLEWTSGQDGCPVLLSETHDQPATVSLSHSENVFVIGIDLNCHPIGVDCEVISRMSPRAIYRYLGESVPSAAPLTGSGLSRLATVKWTGHEALWKALQNLNTLTETVANRVSNSSYQDYLQQQSVSDGLALNQHWWWVPSETLDAVPITDELSNGAVERGDACVCLTCTEQTGTGCCSLVNNDSEIRMNRSV